MTWNKKQSWKTYQLYITTYTKREEKIITYHQCEFLCNQPTTHQIFCTCQMLQKNGTQQGQHIKKATDRQLRENYYTKFSLNSVCQWHLLD
jgi:hypothetical protein